MPRQFTNKQSCSYRRSQPPAELPAQGVRKNIAGDALRGRSVRGSRGWPTVTARLAGQSPEWEPGTAAGYHSITYGFLVGEVIARVTGGSVSAFFAEEVAAPLGADFHIGLAPEHDHRVATLIPDPAGDRPQGFTVGVSDANTPRVTARGDSGVQRARIAIVFAPLAVHLYVRDR